MKTKTLQKTLPETTTTPNTTLSLIHIRGFIPAYETLYIYDRQCLADLLKIHKQYLAKLLIGYYKPSAKLHNKIMALIEEIRAEQEGGLN